MVIAMFVSSKTIQQKQEVEGCFGINDDASIHFT